MKKALWILCIASALCAAEVQIPQGIDHAPYDLLLKKYVNEMGLVDYKKWKASPSDLQSLDRYLNRFAQTGEYAKDDERIAGLLNAYNAFTLRTVLENYPTESIRLLDNPFTTKTHPIGGKKVSLDEIEHDTLRPLIGWKVHALVVCAARSCPPLPRNAFFPDTWENQISARYTLWLNREDLNSFDPKGKTAELSKIFDWYKEDFKGDGDLSILLKRFVPEKIEPYLQNSKTKTRYKPYHWGLNDQSDLGKDYKHSLFKSLF
ncbi:DUF547 domain-containing protein [Kiritimatiellaeota bacterium B1221]|nr:DUF547 domain-containing protein [Kiritimatiellaeota bacterium B1221]